jgi:hypothetical protein
MQVENENPSPNEGEEVTSEDASVPSQPAQPMLNRAERRAQAKGKKGTPAGGNSPLHHSGNLPGGFNRGSGSVGKTRLPRTGHK